MDLYRIGYKFCNSLYCDVLIIAESEELAIAKFINHYKDNDKYLSRLSDIRVEESLVIDIR